MPIQLQSLLLMILAGAATAVAVLLLAPLFEGVLRKVTARVQSRQGPPVWQPYFDLLKLLGKEDIESGEVPAMQKLAACLSLGTILLIACLVPFGAAPVMDGRADCILLIYLLTLCGISTLVAGMAAGSTYSIMGTSREMMCMMLLEPLLAIALVVGAIHVQSLRLDAVLDGSVYAAAGGAFPWSGLIMLGVLLFSFQAFVGRMPFDIAEAETEIMEGALIEYSGPKLALFKWTAMAKLLVYSAIFVSLFVPWGRTGFFPLDVLILLAKVAVMVLGVTLVAATHARYRIDQAIRYYAFLLLVSFAALALATLGH